MQRPAINLRFVWSTTSGSGRVRGRSETKLRLHAPPWRASFAATEKAELQKMRGSVKRAGIDWLRAIPHLTPVAKLRTSHGSRYKLQPLVTGVRVQRLRWSMETYIEPFRDPDSDLGKTPNGLLLTTPQRNQVISSMAVIGRVAVSKGMIYLHHSAAALAALIQVSFLLFLLSQRHAYSSLDSLDSQFLGA